MIFRRKTTRIELERSTLTVQLAPAPVPAPLLCPRCGAPVATQPAATQSATLLPAQLTQESSK